MGFYLLFQQYLIKVILKATKLLYSMTTVYVI